MAIKKIKKTKSSPKKSVIKIEDITSLPVLIEALNKCPQDKRLEMAKQLKQAAYVMNASSSKKISATKKNEMIAELFAVFKSAHAKVELAVALLQKKDLESSDPDFYGQVFKILSGALLEKMKILPMIERKNYANIHFLKALAFENDNYEGKNSKEKLEALDIKRSKFKEIVEKHVEDLMKKMPVKCNSLLFSIPEESSSVVENTLPTESNQKKPKRPNFKT